MDCYRLNGRVEPRVKPSQLEGTAIAANARMLWHPCVSFLGHGRHEKPAKGPAKENNHACDFDRVSLNAAFYMFLFS